MFVVLIQYFGNIFYLLFADVFSSGDKSLLFDDSLLYNFHIIIIPFPNIDLGIESEKNGGKKKFQKRLVVRPVESQRTEKAADKNGRDDEGGHIKRIPGDEKQYAASRQPAELFGGQWADDLILGVDELWDIRKHKRRD